MKGAYTNFLRQIMVKRAQRRADERWSTLVVEEVREEAGTEVATTYIGQRQGMVAQWVAPWQIFEVCARETRRECTEGKHSGARRRLRHSSGPT